MSKLMLLLLLVLGSTSARHLLLRPLRGAEVNELEDTLPEGRSVRTGLAALTGYTVGISKALLGVLIYDVITANVSSSVESETNNQYAQEVCFNTADMQELARSNDEYNPYEDADIYDNLGRQTGTLTDTDTFTSSDTSTDSVDTITSSDENANIPTCIILFRNR